MSVVTVLCLILRVMMIIIMMVSLVFVVRDSFVHVVTVFVERSLVIMLAFGSLDTLISFIDNRCLLS